MLFVRQFLITKQAGVQLMQGDEMQLGEYWLYIEKQLQSALVEDNKKKIIVLGDLFDWEKPEKSNQDIAEDLLREARDFKSALTCTGRYSGEFLIFYYDKPEDKLLLFGDAAAQRETYYISPTDDSLIAGSQPNIINQVYALKEDDSEAARAFYQSAAFRKRKSFPGEKTPYQGLKRLKPNHYLSFNDGRAHRFFPDKPSGFTSASAAAKAAADMLKGFMRAAAYRYKLLIPVSAGWESRIMAGASREFKDEVVYFVLKHDYMTESHQDVRTPRKLFDSLGIPFHVWTYPDEIDPRLRESIEKSVTFPRMEGFSYVINIFNQRHKDCLLINGNVSEVARMEYDVIWNLNGRKIAVVQKYPNQPYAIAEYDRWLKENQRIFHENKYHPIDMLYWEESCGNWVSKGKTEYRMGIEVFSPFNCRNLLTLMLSVPRKYRNKQTAILYRMIIDRLWPELLRIPINPGFKKSVIRLLQRLRIYTPYRNALMKWQLFKAART